MIQLKVMTETDELLAKAKRDIGKLLTEEQIAKITTPLKAALTAAAAGGKSKGKKKDAPKSDASSILFFGVAAARPAREADQLGEAQERAIAKAEML